LAGAIFGSRHHPKIRSAIIAGAVILVIYVFAVALPDTTCFFHLCASGVTLGSAFYLFGLTVVVPILLFVVSYSWHKF
jgi:hypothetical protein